MEGKRRRGGIRIEQQKTIRRETFNRIIVRLSGEKKKCNLIFKNYSIKSTPRARHVEVWRGRRREDVTYFRIFDLSFFFAHKLLTGGGGDGAVHACARERTNQAAAGPRPKRRCCGPNPIFRVTVDVRGFYFRREGPSRHRRRRHKFRIFIYGPFFVKRKRL